MLKRENLNQRIVDQFVWSHVKVKAEELIKGDVVIIKDLFDTELWESFSDTVKTSLGGDFSDRVKANEYPTLEIKDENANPQTYLVK